jgi:uncharacterized protein YraI
MRKPLVGILFAGLAGMFAASPQAEAQTQAFTNQTVNLYAGPAADFPVVAQVPGGVSVMVMGCVAGFSWCDVALPGLRGWVYGSFIYSPWQGQQRPVVNYGAAIGLPIVTFSLGSYWGNYYRDRPWYGNQAHWARHPGPRPVPPPPIRPYPPSHGAGRPPHGGYRPPSAGPGNRPPGAGQGNHGNKPPGAGQGNRPPGAGPGNRPPGAGQGNSGARPPNQGGGRPPGQGGGNRPPGGGGGGGGSGGGGGRPPPGG